MHKYILLTAVMLILPRLFSGAHWASDVIFTLCYAFLWFTIATGTPLFPWATQKITKLTERLA